MLPSGKGFVHDATVVLVPGGDSDAPGAALAVGRCGHREHDAPRALAPHHTGTAILGGRLRLRTLLVVEPEPEGAVRRRIDAARRISRLADPDGVITHPQLPSSRYAP